MKYIVSIALIVSAVTVCIAQDIKFSVELSSDTLLVGNYFELKYTIENASINEFEPPDLRKLRVIGGPNSSMQMSVLNGEVSQSSSLTYYVQPDDIGAYTITPAYLTVGDQVLETPPVEIIVLPNPEGIIQKPHQPAQKYDQTLEAPFEEEKPKRPRRKF